MEPSTAVVPPVPRGRPGLHASPLLASLVVLGFYGLFTLALLGPGGKKLSSFIVAGDFLVDSVATPSKIEVSPHSIGYDGQFYYRLSLDPFTATRTAFGVMLDHPSYRQQRVGYPTLVWLLSFGDKSLVPALMVFVNLVGLLGIAYLGGVIATGYGRSALWGCVFALYPGFLMTYGRDLVEIVSGFWILAGVLALQRRRVPLAAVLFTAAMFCRETTLLVPAGAGVVLLYRYVRQDRRLRAHPWPWMLLPAAAYLLWSAFLTRRWGFTPLSGGTQDVGTPFLGLFWFLQDNLTRRTGGEWMNLFFFVFIIAAAGLTGRELVRSRADAYVKVAWIFFVMLTASLAGPVWGGLAGFVRATSEMFVLGIVIVLAGSTRRPRVNVALAAYLLCAWVGMGLFFFTKLRVWVLLYGAR